MTRYKDPDSLDPKRISPRYWGRTPGDVARALARGQARPKADDKGGKKSVGKSTEPRKRK